MAIPNVTTPPQIGFTPAGSTLGSQIVMGKNTAVTFEAIGYGEKGRPQELQKIVINLSKFEGTTYTTIGSISLDVQAITDLIAANSNIPNPISMTLREVAVCEDTDNDGTADAEKRMIIIGSQTYLPAS